ncbi:MAG: amidohydrolase [Clostridia bacterium]|nr:amidohydrolase [Clostridia bacterium]
MTETELIAFFEDLHAHPELGFEEVRTTEKVKAVLDKAGIPYVIPGTPTGLIAIFKGKKPGKIIALRADMDALPVTEETGLPYASTVPGKMHACGHDFHTACMLAAALELKAREEEIAGEIRVIFQPSEEICNGAQAVIASGLLDDVDEFYAGHTYPFFPAGTLGIKDGPIMAAPDAFRITITGRGAHAGNPHLGIDPIPVACALVLQAQTIVSRFKDAFEPAVLSITHITSGNTWNVVPETAFIEGTLRTMHEDTRKVMHERLAHMAENIAAASECTAKVEWTDGSPALENDQALAAKAREVATELGFTLGVQGNTMGGEDFSEYLRKAPGVFVRVGTGGNIANHHPKFTADPKALAPAAHYFAELALRRARS